VLEEGAAVITIEFKVVVVKDKPSPKVTPEKSPSPSAPTSIVGLSVVRSETLNSPVMSTVLAGAEVEPKRVAPAKLFVVEEPD